MHHRISIEKTQLTFRSLGKKHAKLHLRKSDVWNPQFCCKISSGQLDVLRDVFRAHCFKLNENERQTVNLNAQLYVFSTVIWSYSAAKTRNNNYNGFSSENNLSIVRD